jgi:hypothetical protein
VLAEIDLFHDGKKLPGISLEFSQLSRALRLNAIAVRRLHPELEGSGTDRQKWRPRH